MKHLVTCAALAALTACQQGAAPREKESKAVASSATEPYAANSNANDERSIPAPADGRISQYSSLGKDNCKLVEESSEGPYWRMRCGGVGGFSVDYSESDLRQNITILLPGGAKTSLDLPSKVAHGAFDRLGRQIEWRGPAGEVPDVLVVRVHVANDQGEDDAGQLAIARLSPKPCLVGVVAPQPGQSDKARAIADAGGPCL